MKEEHFGISIVEMMSAGIIVVAHASAGPKMDIIGARADVIGYLANDEASYSQLVTLAMLGFNDSYHQKMRVKAQQYVDDMFGVDQFDR